MKEKKVFSWVRTSDICITLYYSRRREDPRKRSARKKRKAKTTFLFPFFLFSGDIRIISVWVGEMEVFRSGGGREEEEEEVEERRELAI